MLVNIKPDFYTARLRAVDKKVGFPCLAAGMFAMTMVETTKVQRAGTDRHWRCYVNPEWFALVTPDQAAMVLVHELWHLLLNHAERGDRHSVTARDHFRWNVAGDLEINQHDDLRERLPEKPYLPATFEPALPANKLAEEYYDLLADKIKTVAVYLDCGSCSGGSPRPWELPTADHGAMPGIGQERADMIRQQVAHDITEAARHAGNIPGDWQLWANSVLKPRVHWKQELPSCIRGIVSSAFGPGLTSWRRLSRRQHMHPDIVMPAQLGYIPKLKVIFDTSGSMNEALLNQGASELEGLLRSFGTRIQVEVISCDAAAHVAKKITSARRLELSGGGGTDMGEGLAAVVASNKKDPHNAVDLAIVITDGYTPWPAEAPEKLRVVTLIMGDAEGPDWMVPPRHRVIKIPAEATASA